MRLYKTSIYTFFFLRKVKSTLCGGRNPLQRVCRYWHDRLKKKGWGWRGRGVEGRLQSAWKMNLLHARGREVLVLRDLLTPPSVRPPLHPGTNLPLCCLHKQRGRGVKKLRERERERLSLNVPAQLSVKCELPVYKKKGKSPPPPASSPASPHNTTALLPHLPQQTVCRFFTRRNWNLLCQGAHVFCVVSATRKWINLQPYRPHLIYSN